MIHNALVTKSEPEKMVLMNKIIQLNENLKSCKEILDDKIYNKVIVLLNKLDEMILTNISIEKYLNELIEIVIEKHDKFDETSKHIIIYGEKIKEINYNIIEDQNLLGNREEPDKNNK